MKPKPSVVIFVDDVARMSWFYGDGYDPEGNVFQVRQESP